MKRNVNGIETQLKRFLDCSARLHYSRTMNTLLLRYGRITTTLQLRYDYTMVVLRLCYVNFFWRLAFLV